MLCFGILSVLSLLLINISAYVPGHVFVSLRDPPSYGTQYTAAGYIELPYAEIKEPFSAYIDKTAKKSRIDYYGDMAKTYQRADIMPYGAQYKIVPVKMETTSASVQTCFLINGTNGPQAGLMASVDIQDFIPDLTGYMFNGQETIDGVLCDVWKYDYTIGSRKNQNTFWVKTSDQTPVKYHMIGYDSLMSSHYDRYYIVYTSFNNKDTVDPSVFEVPNNSTCGGFPGPGYEHRVAMNPMHEFIHNDDSHLDPMFDYHKHKHGKNYTDHSEHAIRKEIFRQNVRYVNSMNRAGLTYKLKLNRFADRSADEMKGMRGYRMSPGYNGGLPFDKSKLSIQDLPTSIDWRIMGAVSPVKDQGICGSCWSFGTTGTLEGTYFLKTSKRVSLSEQQLIDCSWGFGNNGCDGGEDFRAYQYIMAHGLSTSDQYGASYMAQDGYCNANATTIMSISSYVNVTPYDSNALKMALVNQGPISISIDASHRSLSFYDFGVYQEPQCQNTPDSLDHSVLLVGYGTLNGMDYWLVKNSWSFYWGNDGYVLMSQLNNMCGVLTAPTYANM